MNLAHFSAVVADDHPVCRRIVVDILRSQGLHRIREAADGGEAYCMVSDHPPDLLMLDFDMPSDGLSVLRQIRSAAASLVRRLPVVMLTAYTSRDKVIALRDAGASEITGKPVSVANLLGRVQSALYFPRPFIESATYVGPDRRRSSGHGYAGPMRRATDRAEDDTFNIDVA